MSAGRRAGCAYLRRSWRKEQNNDFGRQKKAGQMIFSAGVRIPFSEDDFKNAPLFRGDLRGGGAFFVPFPVMTERFGGKSSE